MKKLKFIIIALGLALLSTEATAAVKDGTIVADTELRPLAKWVAEEMKSAMPFFPVTIASDRKLEKALHLDDAQHAGAVGAYIPGQIIISNRVWDPASLEAQSYLVHELVHHVQFLSGHIYPCHEAKEREAYTLQNKWLMEHGLKPLVNQKWIDSMSTCKG